MRLEAVPDHVAKLLAVVALDVLENIRLVAASDRPVEPPVLVGAVPTPTTLILMATVPEAPKAAPAALEAPITTHLLFSLLLSLPEPLYLLLFLNIPS